MCSVTVGLPSQILTACLWPWMSIHLCAVLCWVPPPPRPLTRPDGQVLRNTRAAEQPDGHREVLEGPLRLKQTKVDRWYMSGDIGQLPSGIWQLAYDGCQLTSDKWNTALWQLPADLWYMTAGIGHKTDEICQLTAKNLTANSLLLTAVIQQLTANSWQLTADRWQMTDDIWRLVAESWQLKADTSQFMAENWQLMAERWHDSDSLMYGVHKNLVYVINIQWTSFTA